MLECHLEKNKVRCTCTYEPRDQKGNCCECVASHWRAKQLPGCLFTPEGERTYDRRSVDSLQNRSEGDSDFSSPDYKNYLLSIGDEARFV